MKKFVALFVLVLLALSTGAIAAQDYDMGADTPKIELTSNMPEDTNKPLETGSDNSSLQDSGKQVDTTMQIVNEGENRNLIVQQKTQLSAQDKEGLQNTIRQRQEEMTKSQEGLSKSQQEILKNQNQVRLAVQTLLSLENYTGGIGKDISAIAKDFDNSIQSTTNAEEKIQSKSGIARLFSGGDEKSAAVLKSEVTKNQEKIQELKQLKDQCPCDEEVKAMMQEQIQSMEQEQTRLQTLADKETKSKGIFGWMWK
jgi:predicted small secreted protein